MGTVAAWELLEIADEVRPVDKVGNVGDLATPSGLSTPTVAAARYGRGRIFDTGFAFEAADLVADSTLLARDCTVVAWLDYKIENAINGQTSRVYHREDGAAAVHMALELERVSATQVKVRALWDGPGAASTAGAQFPKPDGEFQVAAVRVWNNAGSVDVTYYVNGDPVGSENVAEGALALGTGGITAIGYDPGAVGDYLPQDTLIDFLHVEDDAIPPEEMRQIYRRIAIHGPAGYKILRAFLPPGSAWSRDDESYVQRWIASEGDGLGAEIADIERFREDFMIDRAYGGALEDWERITRQQPKPSDSIQQRRDRVLGFLRTTLGSTIADLKISLEPLFGLTAAQIQIVEFTALREDDFSVDDITTPPSRMWITRDGNGSIAVDTVTPECDITTAGAQDVRWWPLVGALAGSPVRETGIGAELGGDVDGSLITIELAALGTAAPGAAVFGGAFMRNASHSDAIIWGVRDDNSTIDLVYYLWSGGVLSAETVVAAGVTVPQTLAIRYDGGGSYELGRITGGIFSVDTTIAAFSNPRWCGFGNLSPDASATLAASFRNAQVFGAKEPRGFTYLAIRNPALGGTYDLEAAQSQLDKQSPAHTIPIAATSDQGFELGPTGPGLLGSSPLYPKV